MSSCLLCFKKLHKNKTFEILQQLYQDCTIKEAIQEYFNCFKIILSSESKLICNSCYNLLKTFYKFVIKVNNFYSDQIYNNVDLENCIKTIGNDDEEYITEDIIEYDEIESIELEGNEDGDEKSEYLENTEESEDENLIKNRKIDQNNQKICSNTICSDNEAFAGHAANIEVEISQESSQKSQIHLVLPKNFMKISKDKIKFMKINDKSILNQPRSLNTNENSQETQESQTIHEHVNKTTENDQQGSKIKQILKDDATLLNFEHYDKLNGHKCQICQKEFKTAAVLKSHVKKIHSNIRESSTCAVCGKNYTNKYILKTHMRKHIVDSAKTFECYKCNRQMKNLPHLLDHFKYKHDPAHVKSSVCHICSKVVTRLDIHLRQMHSTYPVERVKCEICGHWMKKTSFNGHVTAHNQSGFDCQICGKFLKNKNSFLCHMKRVHTEGKFKCEHCDKTFHQKNRLADHIACQHTGNYLYRCRVEDCVRMFRNSGRRRMHERRIHPKEYEKNFKASYLRENVETGHL